MLIRSDPIQEPPTPCVQRELPCYGAWVLVSDKLPPFDKQVLVVNDGNMLCAVLQNVKRSIAKDAQKDKRWYAVPGWGHELHKVTMWCDLPEAPQPLKSPVHLVHFIVGIQCPALESVVH